MRYEFIPVPECEMCGSREHKVMGLRMNRSQGRQPRRVAGVGVTLKKCRNCELIFADPRPRPLVFSDHYGVPPESYWSRPGQWDMPPGYFAREIDEAKRLLGFTPGMTALDVGAGLGKAMTALQRAGFDTYGIEPSEPFRLHTIEHMKIPEQRLQLAGIEDAHFGPASFDFVTFGAVLEHLQEPGRAIEKVLGWLKPGGVVQAEVPSSRHLVARLINVFYALNGLNYVTNLSPMHPPYHLYEFSIESFRQHGRRVGYEVAEHRHEVCSIFHLPRILHPPLRAYMARTGTGMQLTVWLRRGA
jgi:2-polyprenyl-3-methyl-5-hydroxy-6-metoxy-1,4-benzoquinol methylase